uniref:No apical meristem-associated C-terminal domain-containing protein n=1 Tax=Chenopodium quinoa TaxID=63459 RepID=A0A803MS71_CHEQI
MDDTDNPFSKHFGLGNSSNSGNFTSENSYPQTHYHPGYYYPNTTMPNLQDNMSSYHPQPPFSSESNVVHDATRRECVGASNMHQETSLKRSQMESNTPQSDNIQEEVNAQATSKSTDKLSWTQYMDEDLCNSWIDFTTDSIKGTHQSKANYWKNLVEYYNEWRREGPPITIEQATNHWYKMSPEVSKFNGCYIQIKSGHPSGNDDEQIISNALKLFTSKSENKKFFFTYLHSWKILRNAPKWKDYVSTQSSSTKRTKISIPKDNSTSSSNPNTSEIDNVEMGDKRPMGQKAAKASARNSKVKGKTSLLDEKWGNYQEIQSKRLSLCEEHIRQQDFVILCKDTSNMDEKARKNHDQVCEMIKAKYGMS